MQVTDVVLYGDCRPLHRAALEALSDDCRRVHVWEEGYFRPNWVTLEAGDVNGYSRLPRRSTTYAEIGEILPDEDDAGDLGSSLRAMVTLCIAYHAAAMASRP
jgi:capsular polysaccharide export protein